MVTFLRADRETLGDRGPQFEILLSSENTSIVQSIYNADNVVKVGTVRG
jgi:hypothetical protein